MKAKTGSLIGSIKLVQPVRMVKEKEQFVNIRKKNEDNKCYRL
jgi:hypothetical protein